MSTAPLEPLQPRPNDDPKNPVPGSDDPDFPDLPEPKPDLIDR